MPVDQTDRGAIRELPGGAAILHDPRLNKGTAFTAEERRALGLQGLLPPRIGDIRSQVARVMENFSRQPTDLGKFVFLAALQDRNETLFYRVVLDQLEQLMPIIYTPTVGKACQEYGHIFRRARGLYLSREDRGRMAEVMRNWPEADPRIIVVTDGERILGLGDLGASGMGIPVGKLALYTACAGVPPSACLPVMLDVGTDNEDLLQDPLYLGLAEPRLRGEPYAEFIEEFVRAAHEVYPGAVIQFEDFANRNAFPLLERYRDRICCFNDDIQGTAAVTLAGLLSALRLTDGALRDQRLLLLGAGEAGIGVSELFVSALVAEGVGRDEALRHVWLWDSKGLLTVGRPGLTERKRIWAREAEPMTDFAEGVRRLEPTAIIGVSGRPRLFTREVIEAMTAVNRRPIIFSLSNPTSRTECTAEDAYRHSNGRAVFASGSPFSPVRLHGRTFVPGQGNNAYIFPGVGLGLIRSGATRVTDEMFFEAARTLAAEVSDRDLEHGCIFPPLNRIREVSAAIAARTAAIVWERGLTSLPRPADIPAFIREGIYEPVYREFA